LIANGASETEGGVQLAANGFALFQLD